MTQPASCRRCQRPMVHHDADTVPDGAARRGWRGLCTTCGYALARTGGLEDYPRVNRTLADTVEDHKILSERGLSRDEIAAELGMKPASLRRALERSRARSRAAERIASQHNTRHRTDAEEYVL